MAGRAGRLCGSGPSAPGTRNIMARNTSKQEEVAHRRHMVARLRLQGLTQREIVDALPRVGILDPKTREPYSIATVNRDCKALDAEWRQLAAADTAEHKGRILAELREIKRRAAKDNKLRDWLQALKQEADLVGANEPISFDIASIDQAVRHDLSVLAAGGPAALSGALAGLGGETNGHSRQSGTDRR